MKVSLGNDQFALIDDADAEYILRFSWRLDSCGYATATKMRMHKLLCQHGRRISHLNGDKLDNRRVNLRDCTNAECQYSQRPQKNTSSRFKGVSMQRGKWHAYCHTPKRKYLGSFDVEEDAARAYDAAVRKLYGSLAGTNFESV